MTGTSGSLHNESPIIKSSIPVSKAVEMVRQQRNTIKNNNIMHNTNCTSSINTSDSLSDLEILQQNSSVDNHMHHPYGHYRYQYSSNDADEDDEDLSSHGSHDILKKNNNNEGDNTSLLNDVLAVMSLPKYSSLPGNPSGFKSGESTTSCSKIAGIQHEHNFKHSSDDFHSYSSKNNDSEYRFFIFFLFIFWH